MRKEEDCNERQLAASREDRERFVNNLLERVTRFLSEEASVQVRSISLNPATIDKLDLKSITSILTIEDMFKMIVAFSYERPLLDAIFTEYSAGLRVEPEEYDALLEETAGDMINIVVGNALRDFQQPGYAFALSTPIIINEAKSILRYKKSDLITAEIAAEQGSMTILCITPGGFYSKKLDIEVFE